MIPEIFKKLIDYFATLPGVGPRQAARFAFDFLNRDKSDLEQFGKVMQEVKQNVSRCKNCFFVASKNPSGLCEICKNPNRNQAAICVVEKENDLLNLEKTRVYKGVYHVLGSVLLKNKTTKQPFRINELIARIKKLSENKKPIEIILALSPTTEGDATANYVAQKLSELKIPNLKITRLGRGLATGNELEYADAETLKSALERRQ